MVWQADSVLLSRLAFVLPLAAACKPSPDAVGRLLPYAYLLLQHPQAAMAVQMHKVIGSLLLHLCEQGEVEMAANALPFYMERALAPACPCLPSAEGLSLGLPLALKGLPVGSPAALFCMQRLAERCCAVLSSGEVDPSAVARALMAQARPPQGASVGPTPAAPSTSDPAPSQRQQQEDALAKLLSLLCGMLFSQDYQLLPRLAGLVAQVVAAAPAALQPSLLQHLLNALLNSDDYARRPQLTAWMHSLLSRHSRAGSLSVTFL